MRAPELSVVVVSWNTRDLLRACLGSVRTHLAGMAHETVVVDNASSDGSAEMVAAEFPEVRLLRNSENVGFGAACNAGMAAARGPCFLLLNSDARLVDASLGRLLGRLRECPGVGIIGPRLRFEDGRLQASARRFGTLGTLALEELGLYKALPRRRRAEVLLGGYWAHDREREADWLVGACLLVRREAYARTGGFDPAMFLYGEEVEWCRRVKEAGLAILFSPEAEVVHVGHASAHRLLGERGRIDRCLLAADRLSARWEGPLAGLLAPALRVAGAALKLLAFTARRLAGDDDYGRDVRAYARTVLGHYFRRATGRLEG